MADNMDRPAVGQNPAAPDEGVTFDKDYIMAAVDDPQEARRAVQALQQAGFDVALMRPEELLRNVRQTEQQGGVLTRLAETVRDTTSDEGLDANAYFTEAQQGHAVLKVHAPEDEQINRAQQLLRGFHAHTVKHFGRWSVANLDQQP